LDVFEAINEIDEILDLEFNEQLFKNIPKCVVEALKNIFNQL